MNSAASSIQSGSGAPVLEAQHPGAAVEEGGSAAAKPDVSRPAIGWPPTKPARRGRRCGAGRRGRDRTLDRGHVGDHAGVAGAGQLVEDAGDGGQRDGDDDQARVRRRRDGRGDVPAGVGGRLGRGGAGRGPGGRVGVVADHPMTGAASARRSDPPIRPRPITATFTRVTLAHRPAWPRRDFWFVAGGWIPMSGDFPIDRRRQWVVLGVWARPRGAVGRRPRAGRGASKPRTPCRASTGRCGPAYAGNTVYVGGDFTGRRRRQEDRRARLAAIDASTGELLPWAPAADGRVRAIAVAGGSVYVGGAFGSIKGARRDSIARIDAGTAWCTRSRSR